MVQRGLFDAPIGMMGLAVVPTSAPYIPDSETSKQAADEIAPLTGRIRSMVYGFLKGRGDQGATDHEIGQSLGMLLDTVRTGGGRATRQRPC